MCQFATNTPKTDLNKENSKTIIDNYKDYRNFMFLLTHMIFTILSKNQCHEWIIIFNKQKK